MAAPLSKYKDFFIFPRMELKQTLQRLRAIAEPTRLRLLALLSAGEISVGELSSVLGQSQPRVSRHLRLLVEAGLVNRFRDRHWVYYRLVSDAALRELMQRVLEPVQEQDPTLEADRKAMQAVKDLREGSAYTALGPSPALWRTANHVRPSEAALAEALDDAVGNRPIGDLLDIGSGAGTVLKLLSPRATSAVGVDTAKEMRLLARARLQRAGLADCTLRNADTHDLPFVANSFDTVVLDEVLAQSKQPEAALREAGRVLRPSGCLLIMDRILPVSGQTAESTGPASLHENQLQELLRDQDYGIAHRSWFPGRSLDRALFAAVPINSHRRTGTDD